jgi:hypothetical protein
MRMSLASGALVLALGATSAAGIGGRSLDVGSDPGTVVLANGPIVGFAQDGGRIAWASREPRNKPCRYVVRIRTLASRRQVSVSKPGGPACHSAPKALALAGDRALWMVRSCGNECDEEIDVGSLAAPRDERVALLTSNPGQVIRYAGATSLAGDGGTLAFGWLDVDLEVTPDCSLTDRCRTLIRSATVARLLDGDPREGGFINLPGAAPAAMALSGDVLAILVRGRVGEPPNDRPSEVELRNVSSGELLDHLDLEGAVSAIALSKPDQVAVLVDRPAGRYLEVYRAGSLVVGDRVPWTTAPVLSSSGSRIVFRVGRSIELFYVDQGTHHLATAAATPIGLSIEGRRVAWGENVRFGGRLRGRVRAVLAPYRLAPRR